MTPLSPLLSVSFGSFLSVSRVLVQRIVGSIGAVEFLLAASSSSLRRTKLLPAWDARVGGVGVLLALFIQEERSGAKSPILGL